SRPTPRRPASVRSTRSRSGCARKLSERSTSSAPMEPVLADDDVAVLQSLADMASIGLLQEQAIRHGEMLAEQLQGVLNTRIVIEQAKGAVAQARQVSVDEAFE